MDLIGASPDRRAIEFAREYARLSGKVLASGDELFGDVRPECTSIFFCYDPHRLSTEQAMSLMEGCREKGIPLGMYPVSATTRGPRDLFERGRGEPEARSVLAYLSGVPGEHLPGKADCWGSKGWSSFVGGARVKRASIVVETHGSAACFALGGAVLCGRGDPSPREEPSAGRLPCQAGGECFRPAERQFLGADAVQARVVALLSCLGVSFSDSIIAHDKTFVATLLQASRTACVIGSHRVIGISQSDGIIATCMLEDGYDVGEVVSALNEIRPSAFASFVCLGDPRLRVSARRDDTPWQAVAMQARHALTRPERFVGREARWAALRRKVEVPGLNAWGEDVDLRSALAQFGGEILDDSREITPLTSSAVSAASASATATGVVAYLRAMTESLSASDPPPTGLAGPARVSWALARELAKTSTYLQRLWQSVAVVSGERECGRHACGNRLYEMTYESRVFEGCEFATVVCVACGVIGNSVNGSLPRVNDVKGTVIELSRNSTEEAWVAACVEPLRTISGTVLGPVRSDGADLRVHVPSTGAPGLNWIGIVGVSAASCFALRVPVIGYEGPSIEENGWTLAFRKHGSELWSACSVASTSNTAAAQGVG